MIPHFFMKKHLPFLFLILFSPLSYAEITPGETRMMRITAYYSPLPNQENYATGSYESEKRLNGHGVRGADFTPVYPGMIAAPKNIPFGTIICIPTYGCGAKHDTGGAIVQAGERKLAKYDRLDLWLGAGDEGLNNALAWGLQDHLVTLYPAGTPIAEYVDLDLPLGILDSLGHGFETPFTRDLTKNMKGDDVFALQEKLQSWGYLDHVPTGFFGGQTEQAIIRFQRDNNLIESAQSTGAGIFGKKTRNAFHLKMQPEIYTELQATFDDFRFRRKMNHEERTLDVYVMQALLEHEGFFDSHVGGFFGPITRSSLKDFQMHYGIIGSKTQAYAGHVGPKTLRKLNERLAHFKHTESYLTAGVQHQTSHKNSIDINALLGSPLYNTLEGDRVRMLQKALRQLGFFRGKDTGLYGPKTRQAVIDFQLKHNVIPHKGAQGTGVFGPSTQETFKAIWTAQP